MIHLLLLLCRRTTLSISIIMAFFVSSLLGGSSTYDSRRGPFLQCHHTHNNNTMIRGGSDKHNPTFMNNHDNATSTSIPTMIEEQVIYEGWRRLLIRKVQFPSQLLVDFEVVAQKGTDQAVLIFVW